ncbi:MAG: tRNA adenosine(34) deaminase TadA [Planctomycetes bacterium]|nr:tRNA adenosine(34) deaminase TadA [Planctomycetota bacterium]MBI3845072.1 tRNA adenosine(34) deaminase TadA [Planctomycetota bacterium]
MLAKPTDETFMRLALREAERAALEDEVPIGAVLVHAGRVIGRGHNQRETLRDPTAHAEMIVLTQGAAALDAWRLIDTTLYVTLEPCPMCAGALVAARVTRLVFGAMDPKAGACGTLFDLARDPRLNHRIEVVSGVLANESTALLQEFFRTKRGRESRDE